MTLKTKLPLIRKKQQSLASANQFSDQATVGISATPPPLQLSATSTGKNDSLHTVQREEEKEKGFLSNYGGNISDVLGFGGDLAEAGLHAKNAAWANLAGITTSQAVGATPFLNALGGITGGIGVYNGVNDAMDSDKSMPDRVVGGMGAFGGATGVASYLSSLVGSSAFSAGGNAGLLGTLGKGAMAKGGALAGTAGLATIGKLAGSFAGGYGVGTLINNANNSDYARSGALYGHDESGRERTLNDVVIDKSVGLGQSVAGFTGSETVGHIAGGSAAALGSIATAPFALGNAIGGWGMDKLGLR